jgi:general secretion pathway protein D
MLTLLFCIGPQTLPLFAQDVLSTPAPKSAPAHAPTARQMRRARKDADRGQKALQKGNAKLAFQLYSTAHQLAPDDISILAGKEIARQRYVASLLQTASLQQNAGKNSAALNTLQQAQDADPGNPFVREHLQMLSQAIAPQPLAAVPISAQPTLDNGSLALQPNAKHQNFHFRDFSKSLIRYVYKSYGIEVQFDDSVKDTSVRLDIDHATFAEASTAVHLITNTFTVPLDEQHALVIRDTPEFRKQYEHLVLETLYLPSLQPKEMIDANNMIKNIFGIKQISFRQQNDTITLRAPAAAIPAINRTVNGIYYGNEPEVLLDIRVYQINDNRSLNIGMQLPQQFTLFNVPTEIQSLISQNQSLISQLISSGLVNPGDYVAIAALLVYYGLASGSILSQPFALFGNGLTLTGVTLGSVTLNAALNTSTTKQLDHVQLRASSTEKATFLFGSRYPIITASYSSGTTGSNLPPALTGALGLGGFSGLGANSALSGLDALAEAPQVQYENLGLTLKAMPQIQRNGHVYLQLDTKIEALGGSSLNGIPILNSRAFASTVDLLDGESTLLVSSMTRQEENVLTGIPGISELPGMSWTAENTPQTTVGDLVVVVTPHIVHSISNQVASSMMTVPPAQR